jgi:formylglycine-generating enzyme required for sulfatase activity
MFPANSWGLHDMHGNVWEWCLDHWHDSYEGAPSDGSAWLTPSARVVVLGGIAVTQREKQPRLLRGGSWFDVPGCCRSAYRNRDCPHEFCLEVGFRVVCLPQGGD